MKNFLNKINLWCDQTHEYLLENEIIKYDQDYMLKKSLSIAGLFGNKPLIIYLGSHIIIPIVLFLILLSASFLFEFVNSNFYILLPIIIILGLAMPSFFIIYLRKRHYQILKSSVSPLLELTCICSTLGTSVDSIMSMISESMMSIGRPNIANMLNKLIVDLQRMPSRELAWERFQKRISLDEFNIMVKIIAQSDLSGVKMLANQRSQINSLRLIKIERIEKQANKCRSKIAMSLLLTLIPTLFMIMFTVGVLNFIRSDTYDVIFGSGTSIKIMRGKND